MFTWQIMPSLFKNPNHVLTKDPVVIMEEIMSWLFKDPVVIMEEIMSCMFKDLVVIMEEIMPWLFKDPINSGLAQFDHANQTVKKSLKAKRSDCPPMNFFSQKTTNKIFIYLLAPFILQNF